MEQNFDDSGITPGSNAEPSDGSTEFLSMMQSAWPEGYGVDIAVRQDEDAFERMHDAIIRARCEASQRHSNEQRNSVVEQDTLSSVYELLKDIGRTALKRALQSGSLRAW